MSLQTIPFSTHRPGPGTGLADSFSADVGALFDAHFARVFRVLHRLSDDAALAEDVAQDAFVRLLRRGSLPEKPEAWLITVALNRFRNARSKRARRLRLLTRDRGRQSHADAPPSPDVPVSAVETRRRVRRALDALADRDREILLLCAEGFAYRDIAAALDLNPSSVGTLLARAKQRFREHYPDGPDGS